MFIGDPGRLARVIKCSGLEETAACASRTAQWYRTRGIYVARIQIAYIFYSPILYPTEEQRSPSVFSSIPYSAPGLGNRLRSVRTDFLIRQIGTLSFSYTVSRLGTTCVTISAHFSGYIRLTCPAQFTFRQVFSTPTSFMPVLEHGVAYM